MRRVIRLLITSILVGGLSVGLAWGGASLVPVNVDDDLGATPEVARPGQRRKAVRQAEDADRPVAALDPAATEVLAGAAKVSMFPRPEDYGGTWERDVARCEIDRDPSNATHVPDYRVKWPENPNCLYMGGYGVGPVNSIVKWDDDHGLWVRAMAVSDGTDTVVLALVDGAYYFGTYKDMCEGCGFFDLQAELGKELGIAPQNFLFASTHSHTSPDFIGGWGGVPSWYMKQVADSIKTAVKEAVGSMRPATLEMGESIVRTRNAERRDFYRSAEEQGVAWFRAIASPRAGARPAIFTVASYAAHPVTADAATGVGDADFPAVFATRVEERWGGVGALFQTGLGNMSPRGNKFEMGEGLAAAIPDLGSGRAIDDADVRAAQAFWDQPVTNSVLAGLGVPGFFDRAFNNTPASVSAGKDSTRQCRSASPLSVRTSVSAAKIGPLWITGAPGEIFANYSNTLKERNPGGVTLPLALVNDGLGYVMQSFETDHVGRQGTGFVGDPLAEYEDAYSIDACFGDVALETTIGLLGKL